MELHSRIAAWRKALGLPQRKLATAAGVSVSAVSLWESGGASPSQKHLDAIVQKAMKLTMGQFYGPVPKSKKSKRAAA
jgi:transcriptional regulator with XRE-family HTH domain